MSETIPGTMLFNIVSLATSSCSNALTSPAAEAKPDTHLAARSPLKVVSLAVQMRTAKSIMTEMIRDARLPNLTPIGTQNRLPKPRSKKLNLLEVRKLRCGDYIDSRLTKR